VSFNSRVHAGEASSTTWLSGVADVPCGNGKKVADFRLFGAQSDVLISPFKSCSRCGSVTKRVMLNPRVRV